MSTNFQTRRDQFSGKNFLSWTEQIIVRRPLSNHRKKIRWVLGLSKPPQNRLFSMLIFLVVSRGPYPWIYDPCTKKVFKRQKTYFSSRENAYYQLQERSMDIFELSWQFDTGNESRRVENLCPQIFRSLETNFDEKFSPREPNIS